MPFECTSPELGDYDFDNPEIRKQWNRPDWYLKEDPTKTWTPTDVHGATTMAAFDMDDTHPMFKELRSLGKRVNFAKNYGAQYKKISEMFPDYDVATITAIDGGYYKAFPGIKYYQQYCYDLGTFQPYATNLFGVRYWGVSGHNLINMLIQGGSATFLKLKIIALDEYCERSARDVRLIIPIHDEQQFAFRDCDLHHIAKLQEIMEDWDDCVVPIVADAEITRTYWSEKKEMAHA
jgi:DNA polymerase I-like protein with 3'-5' exonuclease and polymerase domains